MCGLLFEYVVVLLVFVILLGRFVSLVLDIVGGCGGLLLIVLFSLILC